MTIAAGSPTSAGALFALIRDEGAVTRAALEQLTGLSRSGISRRLDQLFAHALIRETATREMSSGGRPPALLAFNPGSGLVLAADLGRARSRVALSDLAGCRLAETAFDVDLAGGPATALQQVDELFAALLSTTSRHRAAVRGIAIALPGPVAWKRGVAVAPALVQGWHDLSIADWFSERYDVPVLVDNNVNVMAIGEHRTHWSHVEHMLYVWVDQGIGCGIIAGGRVHRGQNGAAGDIGHIQLAEHDGVACLCGNLGCFEAVAVDYGEPREARTAGRRAAEVLALCVAYFNPSVIVLEGPGTAAV
jgi:predicted NBD/HSP70 family sugar kinase